MRLVGIVSERLIELGGVARHRRRDERADGAGLAAHDPLLDGVEIDAVPERLADLEVEQRVLLPGQQRSARDASSGRGRSAAARVSTTLKPGAAAMRARSCSGAGATMSSSPDSSAATRVASDLMGRNSMRFRLCSGLSHQSSFTTRTVLEVRLVALQHERSRAIGMGGREGRHAGRGVAGLSRAVRLQPLGLMMRCRRGR